MRCVPPLIVVLSFAVGSLVWTGEPAGPAGADPVAAPGAAAPVAAGADGALIAANRKANPVYQRSLTALLGDLAASDPAVRAPAALALGALQDPAATAALKARFGQRGVEVPERLVLVQALAATADPVVAGPLREAAGSPDPKLRLAAFGALLTIKAATTADLERWAQDASSDVSGVGLSVLAGVAEPAHAEILTKALRRHPNAAVRAAAAGGLGRLGDAADTVVLTTALADGSTEVRAAAAEALADLRRTQAVPDLLLAIETGVGGDPAVAAVVRIAGSDFGWRAARTRQQQQEALDRGYTWCVEHAGR